VDVLNVVERPVLWMVSGSNWGTRPYYIQTEETKTLDRLKCCSVDVRPKVMGGDPYIGRETGGRERIIIIDARVSRKQYGPHG